jgi:uncharacterized protein (DUF488 family)
MTTVYTIGHGDRTFGAIREVLEHHGVAMIVDVRSHPTSRHAPDFRKRHLESAAAAAGIGYRWMGAALGGRPENPQLLNAAGEPDWEAIARTPRFRTAITDIIALSAEAPVAVLCAETSPDHCHRTLLVAPALVAGGARVVHLLADSTAAPHQEGFGF